MPYTSQSSIDRRRALASALGSSAPTPGRYGPLADALRAFGAYRGGVVADQQTTENEKLRKQDMARILGQVTGQGQGIGPIRTDAPMETPEGQEAATSFEMQRALAAQKGESEMAKALATQRPSKDIENYNFGQGLPEGPARDAFMRQITPPAAPVVIDQGGTVGVYGRGDYTSPAATLQKTPDPTKPPPTPVVSPREKALQEAQAKLEVEREAKRPEYEAAIASGMEDAALLKQDIDTALAQSGAMSTGLVGSWFGSLKGSDSYSLSKTLDSIKGRIAFDKLVALKAAGGSLGAVSEKELSLLESALGSIDQGQDRKVFEANLRRVVEQADRSWKKIAAEYQRIYGQPSASAPGGTDQDAIDAAMRIINGQ